MDRLDLFLEEIEDSYDEDESSNDSNVPKYHITFTKNTAAVERKGILPMQTSNWTQASDGSRYGGGYIFAFDSLHDAIRWAFKMDWEFNTKMGSGKISIVEFDDPDGWEEDEADPLSQMMNKGKWWKREKMISPKVIKGFKQIDMDMIKSIQPK